MTTLSPPTSPGYSPPSQGQYEHRSKPRMERAVSSMSHASSGSRRSSRSGNKLDLTESTKDKKRLETKADPTKAITEAQPSAVALQDSNLEDLRTIQHKDNEGNIITDPDRSNPTRPRMERPLDTIRSFNAAAEGTSRSRGNSYNRPMSQYGGSQYGGSQYGASEVGGNRRASYYGNGYGPGPSSHRQRNPSYGNSGYYRNSAYGFPGQSIDEMQDEGQYQPPHRPMRNPYNQNGHAQHQQNGNYNNQNYNDSPVSANSHNQQSYETMTSGSDENGKSTNPSSLNSSFDHLHQTRKPEQQVQQNQYSDDISFAPVSQQQPYANYNNQAHQANGNTNGNTHVRDYDPYAGPSNHANGNGNGNGYYGNGANRAPPPPSKDHGNGFSAGNNPRQPIKLGSGGMNPATPAVEEKRKSWLKRTFSRKQ